MKIYLKVLAASLLLIGILLGGIGVYTHGMMDRAYREMEKENVQNSVILARDVLRDELDRISTLCADWGNWDDMYRFCLGQKPEFIEENVQPKSLEVLNINHILIVGTERRILCEAAIALPEGHQVPPPPAFKIRFLEEGYYDKVLNGKKLSGFLNLGQTIIGFTALPVRKTDGTGDPIGVIVFGSFVRENIAQRLTARLGEGFSIYLFSEQPWYSTQEIPISLESRGVVPATSLDEDNIRGLLLFADLSGMPAFVAVCKQPRTLYRRGMELWQTMMNGTGVILLLLIAGALPLAHFTSVRRLRHLCEQLEEAVNGNDYTQRLTIGGSGTPADLAANINKIMQDRQESAQGQEIEQQRLQSIFSAIPTGILICDLGTRNIVACNPALEQLLGFAHDKLIGQVFEFVLPPDEKYCYVLDHMARLSEFAGELELQDATGVRHPVSIQTVRFPYDGKQALQAVFHDLSPLREAQEKESRVRNELSDISKRKADFVTNLSHEMRTPLSALLGFTDLAGEAQSPRETQGWLRNIRRESMHLLDLVNDLLDHAKLEAGKVTLCPEPTDLRAFIRELSTSVQALLHHKKSVRFFLNIADNVGRHYLFDPLRLRQILLNLLGNAVKFTARGSVTLRVEADPRDNGDQLSFSVIDTGIGIAPDALERIFEHFEQADDSITRNYGGSGLGMTIASKLTRLMNGTLTVRSAVGQGSEFALTLMLPATSEEASQSLPVEESPSSLSDAAPDTTVPATLPASTVATPAASKHVSLPVAASRPAPANILLVEDYALNRQVASAFIRHSGHNLFTSFHGQDAVEKCQTRVFDLILMDIQLPVMDGMEATRQIRAQGLNRNTPIVGLTAHAEPKTLSACRENGMIDVLAKPFPKEDFYAMLERFVGVFRPATADPAHEEEKLPREYIVQHFFFGKRELAEKALDIFLKDAQPLLASITKGIEDGDTASIQHSAHQIKSGAGYLGLSALQDVCQSISDQARTGLTDGLDALLKDAMLEYQRIRKLRTPDIVA